MEKRVWHFTIDEEGTFWSGGDIFDDPEILFFFMEKMEPLPDGRFFLLCQGEECYITSLDTPYVIQNIENKKDQVMLVFPGNYQEPLDPETFFVGEKNKLYCLVRNKKFKALFNRKTYQELTRDVGFDEKTKSYYLRLGSRKYFIKES